MTPSPTVSVLVTVFNRAPFLRECLESILRSSWGDFEVVVVDDCSTDGSDKIAIEFTEADSRVRFHQNSENLGDYPNRNCAASLAKGKLLKYVDADDVIYLHSLAVMVDAMEAFPEAALGLSHSVPEESEPYPILLQPEQAYEKHFLGSGCLSCGPSGAMIRRDAFESVGGFGSRGPLGDADLWLRLAAKYPVVLLPPGLVWWRRHAGQEFVADGAADFYLAEGFRLAMETLEAPGCPLNDECRESAIQKHRQHHARRLLALGTKKGRPAKALRLFRESGLELLELLSGLRPYR